MVDKKYFVVTVDTEADDAWQTPDVLKFENLREITRFQELCEKYSVTPTYLVTYECATRDEALSVLKPISNSGNCEIGHHLHVWTTPPYEKESPPGIDAEWLNAFQFELPDSLFYEKSEVLFEAIVKAFHQKPTSHRAGRWGIDQRTVEWLQKFKFITDSSVVPLTNYSGNLGKKQRGPSFYAAPIKPYIFESDLNVNDSRPLVEVPVTVDVPENLFSRVCQTYMRKKLPGCATADRVFRKTGGGKLLRLDPATPDSALFELLERIGKSDNIVINLMLHSSELALNCSPFSRTLKNHTRVWDLLETIFKFCKISGMIPCTLSGVASMLIKNNLERLSTKRFFRNSSDKTTSL